MDDFDLHTYKLAPQNMEAEQAVLGGMLMDNAAIPKIKALLAPEEFYRSSHGKICQAITDLFDQRVSVDLVTLADELKKRGQLDEVGGRSYIASLLDQTPTAANIEYHAKIVRQKAISRLAIQFATEITSQAYEDSQETNIVTSFQEATMHLMKKAARGQNGDRQIFTVDKIFKHFANYRTTPFKSLDDAIGAFFPKELIVIGGRTGMGKTALMLNILKHTAIDENRPCAFFHAQMDEVTPRLRLLSSVSGVSYNDLRKGKVIRETEKKVLDAQEQINDAPISWFIQKDEYEANNIMSQTQGLLDKKGGLGLVIIENLQQIYWQKKDKFKGNRKQEADIIVNALKTFGIATSVPHLLSSQLTPYSEKENRRPQIGDLKETGRTGEIADKIIMPYRPNYEAKTGKIGEPEDAELSVCKGGAPVIIKMKFIGKTLTWTEVN